MSAYRVLVCGGRDFTDVRRLRRELDRLSKELGELYIIHGGQTGADSFAGKWAKDRGMASAEFRADWRSHVCAPAATCRQNRYCRAAGPIRNRRMLNEGRPNCVIAFPGGDGTVDMIRQAYKEGVLVHVVSGSRPEP